MIRFAVATLTAPFVLLSQPRVSSPSNKDVYSLKPTGSGSTSFVADVPIRADSDVRKPYDIRWRGQAEYRLRGRSKKTLKGSPDIAITRPAEEGVFEVENMGGQILLSVAQYFTSTPPATVRLFIDGFDTRSIRNEIQSVAQMYYTKTTGYSSLLTYGRDLASTSVYGIPQFADPQLASCIPAAESQFKQFVRFIHPFYEQSAWWPNDNATAPGGGGGYIGLMQVKTSMLTAFNWNSNVEHGTLTLSDKIRVAFKYVGKRLLENPRLPRPDVEQIEDISLGYYSGLGSTAGHQYWVPNAKRPNATEWIVAAQDKLKEYVLKVRSCK